MSMLSPFPSLLSSSSASPSRSTTTVQTCTRSRWLPSSASASHWRESGRLTDYAPNTATSQTSPITRIRSTIRSTSTTTTQTSGAQTTSPYFRQSKRYAEFRSIKQQSQSPTKQGFVLVRSCWLTGNWSTSCVKVVLAIEKLRQSWTEDLLQQRFSVHSREGKEIES